MPIALPEGFYWDNELKLGRETAALSTLVWPNYLLLESDIPEPGFKFEISHVEFVRRFPVWGIRKIDGNGLVAFVHAVQLFVDLSRPLPDAGWRFAIQAAGRKEAPNCLCLLVANVDPNARGLGFSPLLIERAKRATRDLGFATMIAPVRPVLKFREPLLSMHAYVSRRNESGEPYDPWIKVHVQSGGMLENVCSESVSIQASLDKWREWTDLALLTTGEEILPQGLVPLKVDLGKNLGVYIEPNVWLRYRL